jgi:hypothetical protein
MEDIKDQKISNTWSDRKWSLRAPDGEVKTFREKLLRVLQKQIDESWKFAGVMWTPLE